MKRTILYVLLIVVLSLLVAACSATPAPQPTAPSPPPPTDTPPPPPTATPVPEPTATQESAAMGPEVESGFAEVNGTRLYYETAGDGEAVVLLHGFGGNTLSWQEQFAALAESYKVVNYDMRGFGQSDNPSDKPYAHADDLIALLDHLGIKSAHVVGHSFGGQIALDFALAYPEATKSLVLIEPDVPGLEGLPEPTAEEQAAFGAIFAALGEGNPAGAAEGLVDNHPIFAISREVPGGRDYHLEVLAGYDWWHFQNEDPLVVPDPPAGTRLAEITAPTLLFTGDTKTEYLAMEVQALAEQLPNVRVEFVKNSDHFPQFLHPDEFNARTLAFLGSVAQMAPQAPKVVVPFDATKGKLPEGLSLDKAGNIYVSLGPPFWFGPGDGRIRKISPDGTQTDLAFFPGGQGPAGVVVNDSGDVFFAWPNPTNPDTNGVYRLTGNGDPERLPGSDNIVLSNGLAFDEQGNIYVSDSAMGVIWRIPTDGSGEAESWFQHEWLAGCDPDTSPVGANGVALWQDSVYVANTSRGLLVRIPVQDDGSAGEAEVVAGVVDNACEPDDLVGMDGIAFDEQGKVYALLVLQNKLVRIDPADGSHTVLLTEADGLYNTSSLAFGTTEGDRENLYMVNYALLPPAPANSLGPAVLKLNVGVDGLPLP